MIIRNLLPLQIAAKKLTKKRDEPSFGSSPCFGIDQLAVFDPVLTRTRPSSLSREFSVRPIPRRKDFYNLSLLPHLQTLNRY